MIQAEVRGLYTNREPPIVFYGSKGYMADNKTFFGRKNEPGPAFTYKGPGRILNDFIPHAKNFIDCMRSRRWQDLTSDILEGHMSTALCHLANISFKTGRKLTFNPHSEKFISDDDANSYLTRIYRPPYAMPDEV